MKTRLLNTLGVVLLMAVGVRAQEAKPTAVSFSAECQMVILPQKLALTLIPELTDDAKIAAAWPRVLELIGKGEATLSATLVSRGMTGEKLSSEAIQEVRYATEFDPPFLPDPTQVAPTATEVWKNWPYVGITPIKYDTRNVGPTLELEVSLRENSQLLHGMYVVRHVRFEKLVKIEAGRLANGERLFVEQPYFSTMGDQSSATFENGKSKLIGVHRLPGTEGVLEIFILTLRLDAPTAP